MSGVCLVRNDATSAPAVGAPDVGNGYAKLAKPGVNTIAGLQSACALSDYASLLTSYCASNSSPIQQQVLTYDASGNVQSLSCGVFGCSSISCPTSPPPQSAPDLTPITIDITPATLYAAYPFTTWKAQVKNIGSASAPASQVRLVSATGGDGIFNIPALEPNATAWSDTWANGSTPPSAGTYTYSATVDPTNAVAEASESNNTLNLSAQFLPSFTPSVPQGVTAELTAANTVRVSWTVVSDSGIYASSYQVYRASGGSSPAYVAGPGHPYTSYTNTSVPAGTYTYFVKACSNSAVASGACSDYSSGVQVIVPSGGGGALPPAKSYASTLQLFQRVLELLTQLLQTLVQ